MSKSICFIAGETSGDQNAAGVCRELKRFAPDTHLWGAAGSQMQTAGCDCVIDLTQMAVVGLVEVAKNYFSFRKVFHQLLDEVARRKPDAVVLTDFAGFNLRFAKALRARGYRGKIIYFVSPQVWASRAGRAQTLAQTCDLLLCLFEFEKDWYAKNAPKLRVEWVGHPLVERLTPQKSITARDENLIGLLPGSRFSEMDHIWAPMECAAWQISENYIHYENWNLKFKVAAVNPWFATQLSRRIFLKDIRERSEIVVGSISKILQIANIAIVASGTATLECAFFGCPMIVVYRVAWPTYVVGRALICVPWIAMPNILAGKTIVPELIQGDCMPEKISAAALDLLRHPEKREEQRRELAEVVKKLGPPGASERAAKAILATI